MTITNEIDVNALAQEIRRVDGNHSLGAGALAEALIPFLSTLPIAGEGKVPEGWQLVPKVGTMVKANHPITCVNPEEWFAVAEIEHRHGKFYVRGENTCWFSVSSLLHMSLNVQP